MSEVIDYIRTQKARRLDDYNVLKSSTRRYVQTKNRIVSNNRFNMRGGKDGDDDKPSNEQNLDTTQISVQQKKDTEQPIKLANETVDVPVKELVVTTPETTPKPISEPTPTSEPTSESKPEPEKSTFTTIKKGSHLYHPSQEVSHFDESMLFVDVTKV